MKCKLSMENYLEVEKRFFDFVDVIYVWDNYDKKAKISTLSLANLLVNICTGIEESLKLLILNPHHELKDDFLAYMKENKVDKQRNKKIFKEIQEYNFSNVSLNDILNFKNFRIMLNRGSKQVEYVRTPMRIKFSNLFNRGGAKSPNGLAYMRTLSIIYFPNTKKQL